MNPWLQEGSPAIQHHYCMCGIGGKVSFTRRPDTDLADAMNACMGHRGPNAEGVYATGPAMLAHRRLSIIDTSSAGRQPMANADGTVHIVFNGEIYNYRELRDSVGDYTFRTETDTEVLLALYEEEGVECLSRLRGMFAFGIWDEKRERLFLARDRLGQKPLFYRRGDDAFWFGSTIKTILADPAVEAAPDLDAIRSYLTFGYVPSPKTGFEGIRQLEPAHYAVVDEEGLRVERYWDLSYADQYDASPTKLASRLRERLREATRLRMRSDVPLGVFLSGGIDSSTVAALMSELSEEPIQTYSIGFDVEAYDELEYARRVATRYDTDHTEYTLEADSMLESLPELVEHYEMPFGDSSALPTYHVSRLAAQDITVALGGDAGDENFAGYDRYVRNRIAGRLSRIPRPILRACRAPLAVGPKAWKSNGTVSNLRRALEITALPQPDSYAEHICHATGQQAERLWNGPQTDDELASLRRAYEVSDGPTELDRILATDLRTYLPDDLLVKVDRASMAHSLEVRSPFLDHRVVEFAARIPAEYKLNGRTQKWILKRAVRDLLPDEVIDRPKQGFGIPVQEWLRGDLRDLTRRSIDRLGDRPAFDDEGMEVLFRDHVDGVDDNGAYLWDLLMLEQWYERFID